MRLASITLLLASLIAGCQESPKNNRPTDGTTQSDLTEGIVPIAEKPVKAQPSPALTLRGHTCIVTSVGFSPDGKRIVSGGLDQGKDAEGKPNNSLGGSGEFKVWDAATGHELFTVRDKRAPEIAFEPRWASFTPDGEQIATSGYGGGPLRLWDAATGQPADPPAPQLLVVGDMPVSYSPDGKRIACVFHVGNDLPSLKVWDTTTGKYELTIKVDDARCVSFSPSGKRIAYGEHDTVKICDAGTGKVLSTFKSHQEQNLRSRDQQVERLSFSPDGRRIASVATTTFTLKVWDTVTGRELYDAGSGNHSPAFSPDGKWIVTGGPAGDDHDYIFVLDAKTGKRTFTLRGHPSNHSYNSMSFSPDGSRIVSCTGSKVVEVWEFPPKQN
jgi:WD40 repeat protein